VPVIPAPPPPQPAASPVVAAAAAEVARGPIAAVPAQAFAFDAGQSGDPHAGEKDQLNRRDLVKVQGGISFVSAGVFTFLGTVLLVLLSAFVIFGSLASAIGERSRENVEIAVGSILVLIVVGNLGILAAYGLVIAGQVTCLSAPSKQGAFGLNMAGLVLTGISLFCFLVGTALTLMEGAAAGMSGRRTSSGIGNAITNLSYLLMHLQFFLSMFFLRAIALCVRADGVAQAILSLIILSGVVAMMFVGLFFVAMFTAVGSLGRGFYRDFSLEGPPIALLTCGCITLLTYFVSLVWYIVSLFLVRGAITGFLRRSY
jgi:hypothetical protein